MRNSPNNWLHILDVQSMGASLMAEDFDFSNKHFTSRRQSIQSFLKLNYRKNLSEDEFVLAMKDFYKGDHGRHARYKRCPSTLRREYRHLNEKYDFFKEKI